MNKFLRSIMISTSLLLIIYIIIYNNSNNNTSNNYFYLNDVCFGMEETHKKNLIF